VILDGNRLLDGNQPFCVIDYSGELRSNVYDDHLRLIGKHIVNFPLVLTEMNFFSLGVTAEELRANIG